jgi:ABC-type amino acid transport substrate-binding protein
VLALRQSISKKQGTFSFGKQDFNSLSDFSGYTVAVAGGGVLTARILSGQGGGNFNVVDAGNGANVITMLDSG